MKKTNDSTIFKFTRKILACNTNPNDFSIDMVDDELIVVYIWGDSFTDGDIDFVESNKGFKLIDFEKEFVFEEQNPCRALTYGKEGESFESFPFEAYSNFVELRRDLFHLYWNVTESKIIIEVHVKTKGWISFGFSITDGAIFNSDIFVGWIGEDGVSHFSVLFFVPYDALFLLNKF